MTYDPSVSWQAIFAFIGLFAAGITCLWRFSSQFTRLVDSQARLSDELHALAESLRLHVSAVAQHQENLDQRLQALEVSVAQGAFARTWKGN